MRLDDEIVKVDLAFVASAVSCTSVRQGHIGDQMDKVVGNTSEYDKDRCGSGQVHPTPPAFPGYGRWDIRATTAPQLVVPRPIPAAG